VPYVLVVESSLPVKDVRELIALAKSQPGKMNYASAGNGSTHQFCAELLKSSTGIDVVHVPYKGSTPGVTAVMSAEVSMMFANLTDIGAQIKAGKVKPLAVTTLQRAPLLPNVPTMAEAGVPGFAILPWVAMFAPGKTPPQIVEHLAREVAAAMKRPDVREGLDRAAFDYESSTPQELGTFLKDQLNVWGTVAREAGLAAH
jgi:tripartite-type tricarboxylate transporter receptor subunit TctC